ncbi:MAG: D-alanine--D-alanine ligase [Patescibacteria group bacterium]
MKKQKLRIVVLMGGPSAEHDISLHTGQQILRALDAKRYTATPVIITKKGEWIMRPGGRQHTMLKTKNKVSQARVLTLLAKKADMVFIALHGTFGEDGTIQSLLGGFGIPYTGSGILASALGMDKTRSSQLFRDAGMTVPAFRIVSADMIKRMNKQQTQAIVREFALPLVIKPSDQGSSVGVSIVQKAKDIPMAIAAAEKYSPNIIIQKFIKGREITCAVIDRIEKGKRITVALPPMEIVPRLGAFYDYQSKYAKAGSDHLIPPPHMSATTIKTIQDTAHHAHTLIGCSGMSRSDFMLDDNNKLHILQINTIPGMTSTSLLPQAAQHIGIEFSELLHCIVESALKNKSS